MEISVQGDRSVSIKRLRHRVTPGGNGKETVDIDEIFVKIDIIEFERARRERIIGVFKMSLEIL